mgnify:CR=1 FL=1
MSASAPRDEPVSHWQPAAGSAASHRRGAILKRLRAEGHGNRAIQAVRSDIEDRLGAKVEEIKASSGSEWRGDNSEMQSFDTPFNNADQIVVFYLGSHMGRGNVTQRQGSVAENIMKSSQLTRAYADQIIQACDPVASVKVFYWEWFQGWSLFPEHELRQDKCKSPGEGGFTWGQNMCV